MSFDTYPTTGEQVKNPVERNLNDSVMVKVTEDGQRIWDEYHAEIKALYPQHAGDYELERDEEGYTTMQLHEVMRIFGGEAIPFGMGSPIETTFKFVD